MHRPAQPSTLQITLLRALAEFRYQLRSFLQFSEQVAQDHGLHPRQHQLLLQIAGLPEGRVATISFLAERLGLRQNSVVELADRSVAQGLVRRVEDAADRRRTVLAVTDKGMGLLNALSTSHARELDELGPQLIRALDQIRALRTGHHNRTLAIAASTVSESSVPASDKRTLRRPR
jgi:DNA-binding MarR family transcriptional regulator